MVGCALTRVSVVPHCVSLTPSPEVVRPRPHCTGGAKGAWWKLLCVWRAVHEPPGAYAVRRVSLDGYVLQIETAFNLFCLMVFFVCLFFNHFWTLPASSAIEIYGRRLMWRSGSCGCCDNCRWCFKHLMTVLNPNKLKDITNKKISARACVCLCQEIRGLNVWTLKYWVFVIKVLVLYNDMSKCIFDFFFSFELH